MAIETLTDWNIRIGMCSCCEMPSCPVPDVESQSLTRSNTYFGFAPVEEPGGEDDEKIPKLFATKDFPSWSEETGTIWTYDSGPGTPPYTAELSQTVLVDWSTETGVLVDNTTASHTGNGTDGVSCYPLSGDGYFHPVYPTFGTPVVTSDCAEDHYTETETSTAMSGSGPFPLTGCPGPFTYSTAEAWNLTHRDHSGVKLTSPKTEASWLAEIRATIPAWPATPEAAAAATAVLASDWPVLGDARPWPPCEDKDPPSFTVHGSARKVRFRFIIPNTFTGSYFKITWDIMSEPEGWDRTINDPEATPPDPLPEGVTLEEWWADHQVPDPDAPDRVFIQENQTWQWTGPGTPSNPATWLSPWFEIPVPLTPGVFRRVNTRYECYRSPYGQKPEYLTPRETPDVAFEEITEDEFIAIDPPDESTGYDITDIL